MTAPLTLGVYVGPTYTGWAARRSNEFATAGTWHHVAADAVDARREPVPVPTPADLTDLLATITDALDGECPEYVVVSEVALPTPTSVRGTISKRALHCLPATAAIYGAVVGAWPDAAITVPAPTVKPARDSLPPELRTPARKGHRAEGEQRVTGGYRGGLTEVRIAWMLAGMSTGKLGGASVDRPTPAATPAPTNQESASPPAPASPSEPPARVYLRDLVAFVCAAAPSTEAELVAAAGDALDRVPRPAGVIPPPVEVVVQAAQQGMR